MTGLATSSGPTLLGKLRALEERIDSSEFVEQRMFDFADLAALLPQIIAQIESDAADAERYRWLRDASTWHVGPGYATYNDTIIEGENYNFGTNGAGLDNAIDAAKDRA